MAYIFRIETLPDGLQYLGRIYLAMHQRAAGGKHISFNDAEKHARGTGSHTSTTQKPERPPYKYTSRRPKREKTPFIPM